MSAALAFGLCAPSARAEISAFQSWNEGPLSSFELPVLSSDSVSSPLTTSFSDARGHIALVHFFATWCEPCRKELPALQRLAARGNGSIKVFIISVDEPELRLRRFIAAHPLGLPILLDQEGSLAKSWTVSSLPTTILFDADLHPRLIARSDQDWDQIDPAALLDEVTTTASFKSNIIP